MDTIKITIKYLREQHACKEGLEWYQAQQYPMEGVDIHNVIRDLQRDQHIRWVRWLCTHALVSAKQRLQDDRTIVMAAVQYNGRALQHASQRLQDDVDIVMAAVQQDGRALQYASPRLLLELHNS